MGILGLGRKKKAAEEVVEAEPVVVKTRTGPALIVLVPEVAGGTSFRAFPFDDTAEAAEYLATMMPAAVPQVHAFWAMMDHPGESSGGGEALVLMRSDPGSELVYAVSFVDIESALSFARFEVKRGLQLGQIMIYWAELVTVSRAEDGIQLTPEQAPAMTPGTMTALQVSPGLEKARRRQEEEKSRLQAELEEIRQRQAQTEELRRRQAQVDDKRKQLALAEKQRRQTKAEEQRRLQAEAREIEKLRAEAEELRNRQTETEEHERQQAQARRLQAEQENAERLQAAAEEEDRLQAELEEIERQQAETEERGRQLAEERAKRAEEADMTRQAEAMEMIRLQAEAEELAHQLADQLRLLADEEKGRRHAERAEKPRLQAEAELTKLLQSDLEEIRRKQVEAEALWQQGAEERKRQNQVDEEKRRAEEEEKRRLEAEEAKRIQDELAEIKRLQAESADLSARTQEDESRRQAEAERAGRLQVGLQQIKRQQIEAQERWRQEAEERRLSAEAEERQRRELEDEKRRVEAEETRAIQAKLEQIRHRLAEAQLSVAPAREPDRQGGPTTNWMRKTPPEAEEPRTEEPAREFSLKPEVDAAAFTPEREATEPLVAAEPEPVAPEEPPIREFSLQPELQRTEEPAREFSLNPEVDTTAFTPEREATEPLVAAEPEPVAPEEPPIREFSLQSEFEASDQSAGSVGFPPEPGDPVAADDLPMEEAETAAGTHATGTGKTSGPASPLWAEDTGAGAEEPAEGEGRIEVTLVAPAVDADDADDTIIEMPALELAAEDPSPEEEQANEFSFGGEDPLVADAPSFLRQDRGESASEGAEEPMPSPFPHDPDADEPVGELSPPSPWQHEAESGDESNDDVVQEPELVAAGEPAAEDERVEPNPPIEEKVAVGANGASSNGLHETDPDETDPPGLPGEEDLSPEMAAFLKSRRRNAKDNPFKGFESPPGRF